MLPISFEIMRFPAFLALVPYAYGKQGGSARVMEGSENTWNFSAVFIGLRLFVAICVSKVEYGWLWLVKSAELGNVFISPDLACHEKPKGTLDMF